jgi:hypothetical protein
MWRVRKYIENLWIVGTKPNLVWVRKQLQFGVCKKANKICCRGGSKIKSFVGKEHNVYDVG